jgi:hypothetical protein
MLQRMWDSSWEFHFTLVRTSSTIELAETTEKFGWFGLDSENRRSIPLSAF